MGLSCASHDAVFDTTSLVSPRQLCVCSECKSERGRCPYLVSSSSRTEDQVVCPSDFSILPLESFVEVDGIASGPTSTGGSTEFSETEGESSLADPVTVFVSTDYDIKVSNSFPELASAVFKFDASKSKEMQKRFS